MMCLEGYSLSGPYRTYVIEHSNKITYFKLQCTQDEYKLVTEYVPNGITYIKEFPNETKHKNTSK